MSLYKYTGRFLAKRQGLLGAIYREISLVDLRPVQKIQYNFDPFSSNVRDFRDLMFYLSGPNVRETNGKCSFKTNVLCDLSEPELHCKLENGTTLIFRAQNLTTLEILQQFNKYIKPLVPKEEALAPIPQTKSQKKK